ncbi:LLM class flavin-dependent oxidoreductase [Actinomadura sp. NEAU-AAG7]|nr:LLM class flavin-dependent oxidoreductase [Actinomadura sp. NEAU-AAG7]
MAFEIGIMLFGEVTRDPVTGAAPSPRRRVRETIEQARVADEVGPAAAAERTERIRLTSSVTVLGSEDPVRVWEQLATIDLLSAGRAEIIAGRAARSPRSERGRHDGNGTGAAGRRRQREPEPPVQDDGAGRRRPRHAGEGAAGRGVPDRRVRPRAGIHRGGRTRRCRARGRRRAAPRRGAPQGPWSSSRSFGEDVLKGAADAGQDLGVGHAEAQQQLRPRVPAEVGADERAQLRDLERLRVVGGGEPVLGGAQQAALEALARTQPVGGPVGVGDQQDDHPGRGRLLGVDGVGAPAASPREVPGGEMRIGPRCGARIGAVLDSVGAVAARGRGPAGDLARVGGGAALDVLGGVVERGQGALDVRVHGLDEPDALLLGLGADPRQLRIEHGIGPEPPAVAAPPPDLRVQRPRVLVGILTRDGLDIGQQMRPIGVGQQRDLRLQALRPQPQPQVEQGRAATDQHLPALGIGDLQPAVGIGSQTDPGPAECEPPRLGVVDRGRPDRVLHDGPKIGL